MGDIFPSSSSCSPAADTTYAQQQDRCRCPSLDGVRGVAVIWVVLHNTTVLLPPALHGAWHALAFLVVPGWIGVQLFFVLSGFLITGGLVDMRGAANYFTAFYARRALRILPLYYSVLVLLLIVGPGLHWGPPQWQTALTEQLSLWLFLVNWTQAPYGFGHFWSLAVEEQFYIVWPFIVERFAARRLLVVCVYMAVLALIMRVIMVCGGATSWAVYSATTSHLDAFALGGAGASLLRMPAARTWLSSRLVAANLVLVALCVIAGPITRAYDPGSLRCQVFGYTVLALCGAVLVTAAAAGDRVAGGTVLTQWLGCAPLRSCGKYSYAIYVFHQLVNKLLGEPWMRAVFGAHPSAPAVYAYSLAIGVLSYAMAYVSYHLLEQRCLALKERFAPRFARVAATPAL